MFKQFIYIAYFLLGIIFWKFYMYQINPDGISYFNIAQNYASGLPAINPFWSPLLSWILAPFLFFKIPAIQAFLFIQLITGFLTLIGIGQIGKKLAIAPLKLTLMQYCAIPLLVYAAYFVITPDLLSVALLVWYLNTVLAEKVNGIKAGILGAFSYFAKTYAFYFIIIHFTYVMVTKKSWKELAKGLAVFFLLSVLWIGMISATSHHLTIGNAGAYNYLTNRPGGVDQPVLYDGLLKPQPHAQSVWYDPSNVPVAYNKPQTLQANILGWVRVIAGNLKEMGFQYEGFSIFAVVIVIYYLLNRHKKNYTLLLVTFILYSLGYAMYHIEDRYIFFSTIVLLLMAATIETRKVFYIILLCSFLLIPMKRLVSNVYYRKDIRDFSKAVTIHGNIASNGEWENSLFVSYYNNAPYYGVTQGDSQEVLQGLEKNHIAYYLVWNGSPTYPFLKSLKISQEKDGLTVYKVIY